MGERNLAAMARITELTGFLPSYETAEDGTQTLRIGELVLRAKYFGLWSDPSVYEFDDDCFEVRWGGNIARVRTARKND